MSKKDKICGIKRKGKQRENKEKTKRKRKGVFMAKSENQKLKTLLVMKILLEKSDEKHWLTCADIVEELNAYGIAAERKSIYNDIAVLQEFGLYINKKRGAGGGYLIGERDFELHELKLLTDAVAFIRIITPLKSRKLISKLEKLCSVHQIPYLQGKLWVNNKAKVYNESILTNIDALNIAIKEHRAVGFKYYKWEVDFSKQEKFCYKIQNEGKDYIVFPLGLIWDDGNYYLVAYLQTEGQIGQYRHYRVDKMKNIVLLDRFAKIEDFDISDYLAKHFNMMGGTARKIKLKVHKDLAGVLIDKYGTEKLMPMPYDENYFACSIEAVISTQFFGWLSGFGEKIILLSPTDVCEEYADYLHSLLKQYHEVKEFEN